MDDPTRKLIEQITREKRSRDEMFGSGSLGDAIKNLELSRSILGSSVFEAMKSATMLQGFNGPWELHAERFRELAAFKPVEYSHIAKILELSNFVFNDSAMQSLTAATLGLQDRFRFPAVAELPGFNKAISDAFAPLSSLHLKTDEIQRALGLLKNPWLDDFDAARSFGSIANLAALGAAVREAPYAPATIQAVKDALGTWTTLPPEIEGDSIRREEFYEEHGLDASIIAIPEPAFTEALETTGIVSLELMVPDPDIFQFEVEERDLTSEEAALFGRMGRAASLLQIFEVKLREFIHQSMTVHCGHGWERKSLPGNGETYQKWLDKQQKAVKNGEGQLELVCYADFTDYAPIITRGDNWQEMFSKVFSDKDDVRVSFRRLEPLRLSPMHARSVTKGDLLTIGTETSRILTAIGVLKKA